MEATYVSKPPSTQKINLKENRCLLVKEHRRGDEITRPESQRPFVSIVVPTLNEARYLPRLLASIRAQTYDHFEIILCDDMSADGTREIGLRYGANVLLNPKIGEYASRNTGAMMAKGEILVFTGADVVWPTSILEDAVRAFKSDPKVVLTYCPTCPYDGPFWGRLEYLLFYEATRLVGFVTRRANASTAFMAVKVAVFRTVGGFESSYGADSKFSRVASKMGVVRPLWSEKVWVSARRLKNLGFFGFNKYNFLLFMYVFLPPLTKSRFYRNQVVDMYQTNFPPIRD